MSTIINARDVLLQATVPRLLPALLPGNLTVATTNVIGFPDFYSSVRSVEISTTNQVFVSTTIAGVTPSSIVLTAKLNNILGTVTWSIVSGSATFTTNTNTLSIANSGMTSNVVVFQASVTSNGITYTDRTTVVKVVQGSSTVTAFLTNETFSVAALAAGSVLSYAYSGGTYKVFSGSTEVTGTAVAYSIVSSTGVSATVATTGIYSIDNMTSDSASFVIRAIYAGITVDKTYSVTKSKSTFNGDTGSNGARGTVNIARSITGSIWSDTEARLALSTNGYGLPQIRDIVTLYNTSTNYSESKFYDGTNFLSLDAYVNGNLLVTGTILSDKIAANAITSIKIAANAITADKITAGTITADKIDSRGLSIKDANGNIILAAGNALDYTNVGGTKPPSNANFVNNTNQLFDGSNLGGTANWSGVANNDGNLPANRATVGATFGTNVFGQITRSTASTYIANAAIDTAQIANLAVGNAQIANAAITSAKIGSLQVDSLQLANNSVTVPVFTEDTTVLYQSVFTTGGNGRYTNKYIPILEVTDDFSGSDVVVFIGIRGELTSASQSWAGQQPTDELTLSPARNWEDITVNIAVNNIIVKRIAYASYLHVGVLTLRSSFHRVTNIPSGVCTISLMSNYRADGDAGVIIQRGPIGMYVLGVKK